ncbi:cytoskeletal protein binding protein [Malassezia sp. CBS 17886]|nr:cytoskeletal protein binding protein [Malassezia sp. CBS 17886]
MVCIGIAVALYDYGAQAEDELSIHEGESLYLEALVDGEWYRAARRTVNADGAAEKDAPGAGESGLVPANYVDAAPPLRTVQAMYEYTAQNGDELSFADGATLDVFEADDQWLLARSADGAWGMIPENYVRASGAEAGPADDGAGPAGGFPAPVSVLAPVTTPDTAAAYPAASSAATARDAAILPPPQRAAAGTAVAPAPADAASDEDSPDGARAEEVPTAVPSAWARPGGAAVDDEIKMWSVTEMDAKKRKKRAKGTLGVGQGSLFFATDANGASVPRMPINHVLGGDVEKGKYLVISLSAAAGVPHDAMTFHVGSKAAGDQILDKIQASRRLASSAYGAAAAPAPSSNSAPGTRGAARDAAASASRPPSREMVVVLYDFAAQGDDELSVSEHDQLTLMERENDEWWKLQSASGAVGVVPAAYVEVLPADTDDDARAPAALAGLPQQKQWGSGGYVGSTGKGSLRSRDADARGERDRGSQLRSSGSLHRSASARKSAPADQMRTWRDATGRFQVEAELVGVRDGMVRLHKANGTCVDVALDKLSEPDAAFLEQCMGRPRAAKPPRAAGRTQADASRPRPSQHPARAARAPIADRAGVSSEKSRDDWFDFFLDAGIDVDNCTRYATAFERDQIDDSLVPALTTEVLRSLGLREGDIIRVRRLIERTHGTREAAPPDAHTGRDDNERLDGARAQEPRSDEALARQKREDEALARRLQAQEISAQRRAGGTARRSCGMGARQSDAPAADARRASAAAASPARAESPTRAEPARTAVDAETIAAAVELLRQREREQGGKQPAASVAREANEQRPADTAERAGEAAGGKKETAERAAERAADPNSALFDKLAAMKPASRATPPMDPMGTGFAPGGVRAPFAPVPANQGLLQPLIPLQGTGQSVPTGMPTGQWGHTAMVPPQATGYMPQQQGLYANATGMSFSQGFGVQPAPPPQAPTLGAATAATTADNDKYSAANVFQQMKTGAIGADTDAGPQSSGRYDALRAQPTGFASGGIVGNGNATPQMDMQGYASPFAPPGGFMMPPGYYGQ